MAARLRHGRVALALVTVALLVAAFGGVVSIQRHEHRPVSYGWTNGQEIENDLTLTGPLRVAADPVVVAAQRHAAPLPAGAKAGG